VSYDAGRTWSEPTPIDVQGLPPSYQRPVDPALTVLSDGQLRMYFSSSEGTPAEGLTTIINSYSAVIENGIMCAFEPEPRFNIADRPVIDPTAMYFRGQWHYIAPRGAPQEGAHHTVSPDGIVVVPKPYDP